MASGCSFENKTAVADGTERQRRRIGRNIIETAKCKGMDVGLNLKRGGPSISTDFLVWRHGGLTEGVDIGQRLRRHQKEAQ